MTSLAMPILETERLRIRPLRSDDLNDVFRIVDCDCFASRSPDDTAAKDRRRLWLDWNIAGARELASLGQPPYGDRAIERKSDGVLIGLCGLVPALGPFRRIIDGETDIEADTPEVGLFYAVETSHRRQGYAADAAKRLLEFAFDTLRLNRVVATTEFDNAASIAVMQRCGMSIYRNDRNEQPEVVGCLRRSDHKAAVRSTTVPVVTIQIESATTEQVPLLARMNQQLIRDEGSRNPMVLPELEDRMRGWLAGDWESTIISADDTPIGYVLYRFRVDEYDPTKRDVYVRQYFIDEEHRRRGIGRMAFERIADSEFRDAGSIVLDVLSVNPVARRFWQSLEFEPYCLTLKRPVRK